MARPDRDTAPKLSQDAAVVLALARTAMPFACSYHDEAERWLRLLRMHGEVGTALQALGVGEAPLEPPSSARGAAVSRTGGRNGNGVVELISARACEFAAEHRAGTVGTVHILFAVLSVYGVAFDHELYRRGTTRDELFEKLTVEAAARVGA